MYNKRSLYALNKNDPDGIISIDAYGNIIRQTAADFASETEFRKIKEWSDENYRLMDNGDSSYNKHKVSLDRLPEDMAAAPSIEEDMETVWLEQERETIRLLLLQGVNLKLSPSQRRRLWLFAVDGLKEEQIAAAENVTQQAISKSIKSAGKIVAKYIVNNL